MKRLALLVAALAIAIGIAGCAGMSKESRQRQVASMLAYLFPNSSETPAASDAVAVINVPFRIGVAFVPDNADPQFRLSEADRLRLAGQVRNAFAKYPFVREIEAVPSVYLEAGGGFANIDRIAALLRLDAIALVSYDQVQHADASALSVLYWTGIGAYIVPGDRYDVLTVVETAVFDIKSRRLLMRAAGTSNVKGSATLIGFSEQSRDARLKSFEEAVGQMIGHLHGEVKAFRERAPTDPKVKLVLPPGYNPAAERAAPPAPQSPVAR
ncbi:MAG: rhombotarget lipoprotein [Burkholderiaceae bacterium]